MIVASIPTDMDSGLEFELWIRNDFTMSMVTGAINESRAAQDGVSAHNWGKTPTGQSVATPVTLTSKRTDSIAPQNIVAPTWRDVLDTLNPLQQLPVVGEIYRSLTGDKISGLARVAGGFLYGGVAGGLTAAMIAAYAEAHEGNSPAEQIIATLTTDSSKIVPVTDQQKTGAPAVQPVPAETSTAQTHQGTSEKIPTVTVTAKDARNTVIPEAAVNHSAQPIAPTPKTGPKTGPETGETTPEAGPITSNAIISKTAVNPALATLSDLDKAKLAGLIQAQNNIPLRERLNQKRAVPGFSNTPHPLSLSSYLPAGTSALNNAINLGNPSNSGQNLDLLQGINPMKAATAPVTTAAQAGVQTGGQTRTQPAQGNNPLPADLVRDMMLQALDKYQKLPQIAGSSRPETQEIVE